MGIKSPTVHCFQKPGQWLRSIYFLACSRLSFIGGNTKGANIKAGAHLFANNITSTVSVHLNFESGPWLEDLQSSQSWPQTVRHWQTLFPKKKKTPAHWIPGEWGCTCNWLCHYLWWPIEMALIKAYIWTNKGLLLETLQSCCLCFDRNRKDIFSDKCPHEIFLCKTWRYGSEAGC